MEKQKTVTCHEIARIFTVTNTTVQRWVREFEIPYYKCGKDYILPPNALDLLHPHLFLTAEQRRDRAEARKLRRLTAKTMKARSKAAKQAWETRRSNNTNKEFANTWDTYGYELYRAGI